MNNMAYVCLMHVYSTMRKIVWTDYALDASKAVFLRVLPYHRFFLPGCNLCRCLSSTALYISSAISMRCCTIDVLCQLGWTHTLERGQWQKSESGFHLALTGIHQHFVYEGSDGQCKHFTQCGLRKWKCVHNTTAIHYTHTVHVWLGSVSRAQ